MFLQNDAIGDFLDALYDRQISRAGMEQIGLLPTHSTKLQTESGQQFSHTIPIFCGVAGASKQALA